MDTTNAPRIPFAERLAAKKAALAAHHADAMAVARELGIDRDTMMWEALDRSVWVVAVPCYGTLGYSVRRRGERSLPMATLEEAVMAAVG